MRRAHLLLPACAWVIVLLGVRGTVETHVVLALVLWLHSGRGRHGNARGSMLPGLVLRGASRVTTGEFVAKPWL